MDSLTKQQVDNDALVAIGRLVRPWGLDGGLVVDPLTDDLGRFERLTSVWLSGPTGVSETRVLRTRPYKGRVIVWLEAVERCEHAEALVGCLLSVEEQDAQLPDAGDFFVHDLVGLTVKTVDGTVVGCVSDVMRTAANDVFVVQSEDKREILIPSVKAIVR